MTRTLIPLAMLLVALTVSAQSGYLLQPESGAEGPKGMFGIWGTRAQCRAHQVDEFENPGLYPYEISHDWIRQGQVYCFLRWRNHDEVSGLLQAMADAQCGEDTIRDFRLVLELQNEKLRIHWSSDFSTKELQSCSGP